MEEISRKEILFKQYEYARDEITKSIFIQYDVIKLGTLFLSTLLVAIPSAYIVFGGKNLLFLSIVLLAIAFISMSFVYIMGAGEIRIMRAAAFSSKIIAELYKGNSNKKRLIWDDFVHQWNEKLCGEKKSRKFQERVYLAMPFTVIAVIADLSSLVLMMLWLKNSFENVFDIIILIVMLFLFIVQIGMYLRPAKLSRDLQNAMDELK